jgi:ribosomal subunit interface protein
MEKSMPRSTTDVRVSGKNLDIGTTLRGQAEERIHEAVSKYFDGGFRSRVTVEKEGTGFRADCTVYLDTGAVMRVSGAAHDAYSSVSQVVERIGKQMRRDKRKRQAYANGAPEELGEVMADRADGAGVDENEIEVVSAEANAVGAAPRPIVAEMVDRLETMQLPEAIGRMEAGALASLVFRNRGTGRVNILHERADGSIGWIDVDERDV